MLTNGTVHFAQLEGSYKKDKQNKFLDDKNKQNINAIQLYFILNYQINYEIRKLCEFCAFVALYVMKPAQKFHWLFSGALCYKGELLTKIANCNVWSVVNYLVYFNLNRDE
jgi:hypothetical protein